MAKINVSEFLESLKEMTVLELNELVKAIEEEFGVTAAAPVAAAPVAAAGEAAAEEKKQEITPEIAAVIAQAIKDYQDDVHVEESGVITLIPKHTPWSTRVSSAPKSHW